LNLPIIALTGSNGNNDQRTIHVVLSKKKFNTQSNVNQQSTEFSTNSETEIGIVEMMANHKKEIEFLCELAKPDYGITTNFESTFRGFGGVEGVIEGKGTKQNLRQMINYFHKLRRSHSS
jgi:UDP-N-acetylmuramoyl-tripeptide--D-alanyl-D-alanine ligase